jgi:hypothetical protein
MFGGVEEKGGVMRSRLLATFSAILVAGGVLIAATASHAGASSEFTIVAHTTNVEFLTARGASPTPTGPIAPGDRLVLRQDVSKNGVLVGYSNVVCTAMFNDNALCDAIIAIRGKGDLHATALIRGALGPGGIPEVFDTVVDGGTFAYRNARGDAHVVVLPNGDQVSTIILV